MASIEQYLAHIEQHLEHLDQPEAAPAPRDTSPAAGIGQAWGNAAPLALAAFAVTTFMLSMFYIGAFDGAAKPVVFGVALMFGGITQLIAGLIVLRNGNTFGGVLFMGFGGFWLSLFAFVQFFLKGIPVAQVGHAQALFVFAFGAFIAWMFAASFRTNVVVVAALGDLVVFVGILGAGLYADNTALVKTAGWLGLVAAALAAYLSFVEMCEATYGREILPIGHLAKK
jgi:succinate-acetate transporter protein